MKKITIEELQRLADKTPRKGSSFNAGFENGEIYLAGGVLEMLGEKGKSETSKDNTKIEIIKNQKIKCYDNGGETADRYTVVFLSEPWWRVALRNDSFNSLSMNANPFFCHGISIYGEAIPGPHLGKRIAFKKLPADCQEVVMKHFNN